MRRPRGLTLVELLVVIAIVGLVLGLVSFGVVNLLARAHLTESIVTLETRISEARRQAKRQDRDIALDIYESDGAWYVALDGRATALPRAASISTGDLTLQFEAPFGTYHGGPESVEVAVRNVEATVTVTGVLGRTVVRR